MFNWSVAMLVRLLGWSVAHDGVVILRGAGGASCYGVALDWNLLLTTSSCAQSSQVIVHHGEKCKIERVMHHPRGKRLLAARRLNTPHKLAIVKVKDGNLKTFVRLLSIEMEYLVGTQVVFTTVAKLATLKEKTVKYCLFELKRSGRAYICTAGDRKENCSLEGLPLFSDERVIGLSDKQRACSIQRVFISVGSSIPWINSVLRYNIQPINYEPSEQTFKQNDASHFIKSRHTENNARTSAVEYLTSNQHLTVMDRARAEVTKAKTSQSIKHSCIAVPKGTVLKTKAATGLQTLRQLTIHRKELKPRIFKSCSRMESSLNLTENLVSYRTFGTNKKITIINARLTTQKGKIVYVKRNAPTDPSTVDDLPTTEKASFALSAKHAPVQVSWVKAQRFSNTTTTHSTVHISSSTKCTKTKKNKILSSRKAGNVSRLYDASTNAMDWFKMRLEEKSKKGPPPVLILTTSEVTEAFVDLT